MSPSRLFIPVVLRVFLLLAFQSLVDLSLFRRYPLLFPFLQLMPPFPYAHV